MHAFFPSSTQWALVLMCGLPHSQRCIKYDLQGGDAAADSNTESATEAVYKQQMAMLQSAGAMASADWGVRLAITAGVFCRYLWRRGHCCND
jgi:hypothetical protein